MCTIFICQLYFNKMEKKKELRWERFGEKYLCFSLECGKLKSHCVKVTNDLELPQLVLNSWRKDRLRRHGYKAPGPGVYRGTWTWPAHYAEELGHGPIAMVKEIGVPNKAEQAA